MRGSCSSLVLKSSDDAPLQGASKYILCDHHNNAFISQYRYVSPRVYRARAQAEPYLEQWQIGLASFGTEGHEGRYRL